MSETKADDNRVLHFLDLGDLGLKDVPVERRSEAKKEVAGYLLNETLRLLESGKSPVKGEKFNKLKPDYARAEKGGRRTPTLQLEGNLLDSFIAKPSLGMRIKIGHEGGQAPKADGHNQFTSKSKKPIWNNGRKKLPKRRYIPDSEQKYRPSILREVKTILEEFKTRDEIGIEQTDQQSFTATFDNPRNNQGTIGTSTDNLFNEDSILELMRRSFAETQNGG